MNKRGQGYSGLEGGLPRSFSNSVISKTAVDHVGAGDVRSPADRIGIRGIAFDMKRCITATV